MAPLRHTSGDLAFHATSLGTMLGMRLILLLGWSIVAASVLAFKLMITFIDAGEQLFFESPAFSAMTK